MHKNIHLLNVHVKKSSWVPHKNILTRNFSQVEITVHVLLIKLILAIYTALLCNRDTIIWTIFAWNYFIVRNVREKKFSGCPVPTKTFQQRIKIVSSLIAIVMLSYYKSFIPCRIDYQARTVEKISNRWLCQIYLAS